MVIGNVACMSAVHHTCAMGKKKIYIWKEGKYIHQPSPKGLAVAKGLTTTRVTTP